MPYRSAALMEALQPLGNDRAESSTAATRINGGRTLPGNMRDGSRTMVINPADSSGDRDGDDMGDDAGESQETGSPTIGVLRLRPSPSGEDARSDDEDDDHGRPRARRRPARVQWTEDVIDNEGLGRKSSKICCIYHKPKAFDESSDESSSSEESGSQSSRDSQDSTARSRRSNRWSHGGRRPHSHAHSCKHDQHHKIKPNAYEKAPSHKTS